MEKRQEERISVDSLPDCLKNVVVATGMFQDYSATTVDASNNGMGLLIDGMDEKHVPAAGDTITIKVSPYGYNLKARVTYVNIREDNQVKCGINFVKVKPLDQYQEILTLDIYKK
ncbi:MAG: PilZ domain-containing protein [Spirochaetales bacterium]|nr:PilZ domain-containing protein [Spirochaetales bacterium]MBR6199588.1 PilZ domain-containing protein [Spirochaetales bacterium]